MKIDLSVFFSLSTKSKMLKKLEQSMFLASKRLKKSKTAASELEDYDFKLVVSKCL